MPDFPSIVRYLRWFEKLYWFNPKAGDYWMGATLRSYYEVNANYPADRLTAIYCPIFRKMRFDWIGTNVKDSGGVGARIRVGVYRDNGAYYPSELLLDAGEINAETTGEKTVAIDLTLEPENYWIAFVTNDATIDVVLCEEFLPIGYTNPEGVDTYVATWYITRTYGALPDPFPTGASASRASYLFRLHIAEVFT